MLFKRKLAAGLATGALALGMSIGVAAPANAASYFRCVPQSQTVTNSAFPNVTIYYTYTGYSGGRYYYSVREQTIGGSNFYRTSCLAPS